MHAGCHIHSVGLELMRISIPPARFNQDVVGHFETSAHTARRKDFRKVPNSLAVILRPTRPRS